MINSILLLDLVMKITHIISETTTSGSVATVASPLFKQSRKGGNLLTGTKTKKKYANSISEGKMKELAMDLKSGKDGLTDEEFKKKYGKSKQEMRKSLESKPEQVKEAELQEDDLILIPGQGRSMRPGFISKAADRTDREVEMALGDLFQAAKNAKMTYDILKDVGEDEGIEGWVQEKIIKASDYLNTIREYLENKRLQREGTRGAFAGGVIAGGPQYEGMAEDELTTGDLYLSKKLRDREDPEGINSRFVPGRKETPYLSTKPPSSSVAKSRIKNRMARGGITGPKGVLPEQGVAEGKRSMSRAAKGIEKYGKEGMQALAKAGREGKDLDKIRDKYNKYDEGAKVDSMVKHIEDSEEKAGKSKKEAENIAWATANKRGMLNNRNKK